MSDWFHARILTQCGYSWKQSCPYCQHDGYNRCSHNYDRKMDENGFCSNKKLLKRLILEILLSDVEDIPKVLSAIEKSAFEKV